MGKKTVQHVMIKGNKQGLTIVIDDHSSFTDVLNELHDKLSLHNEADPRKSLIHVTVHTGNRYLTEEQSSKIISVVQEKGHMRVDKIESNVILLEESRRLAEEKSVTRVAKIIRSGQVLEVKGDLLLVGDVNPGGTVKAGGNIFVLGTLRGKAQAGINGKQDSIISASIFKPTFISIGTVHDNSFEYKEADDEHFMQFAYVDESDAISIDRLQVLNKIKPTISLFEGGS